MKAKQEIRAERNDVFSFWVEKKALNEFDEIVINDEKVDECTLIELEKRIAGHEAAIADLQAKIAQESEKISLINAL